MDEADPTDSAMTVTDEQAREQLQRHWGFAEFRTGQAEVIRHLLDGHSSAAVFPTGGGKSLCYQLPALLLDGLTIVVSPLIALMKDQIDALASKGIAARRIDSTLTFDELRVVMSEVRAGTLRLLYVAPERFNNERFRQSLHGVKIALFAVDEAHCISEWGHNFRPDYLKLVRFARAFGAQRMLGLTATATPAVLEDICRQFEIAPEHAVRTPFYRPNLEMRFSVMSDDERDAVLMSRLHERPRAATIVYVTRQATAERVASMIAADGFDAVPYHAGMKPEKRAHVQEGFMRGRPMIVVATIAFGMGVDKADIRYVYHYNFPKSIESYAQEIGRAGRDGERSMCELIASGGDVRVLENFAHGDTPSAGAVTSLVTSVFRLVDVGERFDVSFYDLSIAHDIRVLVVRTLLTYLELDGFVEAGTPFYQTYRFKPKMSSAEILASFEEPRRSFLKRLLSRSEKARTWFALDVDAAVGALKASRAEIVGALDELHDEGFVELSSSGMRHPFDVLRLPPSVDELAVDLHARCVQRETRELDRLRQVFALVESNACQASMLSAHFGEPLQTECGHCGVCTEHPRSSWKIRDGAVDEVLFEKVQALRREDPKFERALAEPRAVARFLCGLSSPLTTRARLTRHALFGALADTSFPAVLAHARG